MEQPMLKYFLSALIILVAAVSHFLSSAVDAQTPPSAEGAPPFNPSFGDLMNTLVQPRHAKLGLIIKEQNWTLATYEIHQLKDALANIAKWRPRFAKMAVAEMMGSTVGEPISALENAVQTRDPRQLAESYARLTEGCNSCHAALNHPYIVIQSPDLSTFANQNFKPPK
jgi:hypothetical protein